MNILFTATNTWLSRIIRFCTKEPVSHCALEYGDWVIHSNLLGVHVESKVTFRLSANVVFSVAVIDNHDSVMAALSKYEGSFYDFGALLYMGLRYLLPFLPGHNLWQSNGMFLCTEWITEVIDGEEDSSITPYGLYLELRQKAQGAAGSPG